MLRPDPHIGAKIIAKTLKSIGVKRMFLFPGGTIAPLLDALVKEGIDYICARNEQGAGYAAVGAAKVTGFPQVVIVTSGPGVTNVLTPIADAYYDSVPLLVFTGQVGTKDINFEKKIRQTGFQETDTVNIFKPVTKKAHILSLNEDISRIIFNSFMLTKEDRPGPVLIDLPMDVQRGETKYKNSNKLLANISRNSNSSKNMSSIFSKISELISKSKRPLILAGNGIYISGCINKFRSFVKKSNIPVVCSMPAVGTFPSGHPLCFSFIGHTGEYFANLAAYYSDLLIVLGARLDLRQTGTEINDFKKNKTIIRVDIDENELEFGQIKGDININMDLKQFFTEFLSNFKIPESRYPQWIDKINTWKNKFHSSQFYKKLSLCMYDVIKAVDEVTRDRKVIVSSGVGSHQQIVARYFTFDYPWRRWLTSAGHGTMGFDIPTNIGAVLSAGKNTVGIVFVGDGSFQMNIQELATIKEYNLPIKIFVLDNKRLGIVSQFQLLNWGSDPSTGNKSNPSFSKIGEAYGLKGFDIYEKREIPTVLKEVFEDLSPGVVHCHIDSSEDVLPMLLGGQRMNQMYPFKREETW
ncbi:thiamine pyrophosphate-binding protein [Candidatus Aerophobetes bacterium]|nr:thiamine pyrophosphate-binding protein [Candidatus Aerophobetes bacterium]